MTSLSREEKRHDFRLLSHLMSEVHLLSLLTAWVWLLMLQTPSSTSPALLRWGLHVYLMMRAICPSSLTSYLVVVTKSSPGTLMLAYTRPQMVSLATTAH